LEKPGVSTVPLVFEAAGEVDISLEQPSSGDGGNEGDWFERCGGGGDSLGLRIIIQFEAISRGGTGRWEDWRAGMTARRELDNIIHPLCDDDEGTWRWERLLLIHSHVVNPMSILCVAWRKIRSKLNTYLSLAIEFLEGNLDHPTGFLSWDLGALP